MKILVPVPVEKRLPAITAGEIHSSSVIISLKTGRMPDIYKDFAYVDVHGEWHDNNMMRFDKNQVIAWYEEIEIESLFPDDKTSVMVAANASGKSFTKMLSHQEGQTYIQNYIIKKLKS